MDLQPVDTDDGSGGMSDLDAPVVPNLSLPDRSVVVWQVSLAVPGSRVVELEQTLSPDEQARMLRYCFEHTRRAFAVSRAALRMILARCCNVSAAALRFEYNEHGKPVLASPFHHLHFSLSHSGDAGLVALSADSPVGVDIERVRPVSESLALARRYFSGSEFELLRRAPDHDRDRVFLSLWTRKEASLKALGFGLSVDPAQVDAAVPEVVTIAGRAADLSAELPKGLCVRDIDVQPGYVAAVAMNGVHESIDVRTFSAHLAGG
jgi:4'-phosphopantetheinyl transferase